MEELARTVPRADTATWAVMTTFLHSQKVLTRVERLELLTRVTTSAFDYARTHPAPIEIESSEQDESEEVSDDEEASDDSDEASDAQDAALHIDTDDLETILKHMVAQEAHDRGLAPHTWDESASTALCDFLSSYIDELVRSQ